MSESHLQRRKQTIDVIDYLFVKFQAAGILIYHCAFETGVNYTDDFIFNLVAGKTLSQRRIRAVN